MGKRLWLFLTICMFTVGMAFAQRKITGKVIEKATGEPVVGASVLVKGTTIGAVTDLDGNFTINNVPADGKVIRVTYIGMVPVEENIRNSMRIIMDSDAKSLDETIVIAYGTMKKSSFTGSAAEIKADDIAAHVSTSITSSIANTTAGVQFTSTNGDPADEKSSIRIRGIGSMYASNDPLIILDGMPYEGVLSNINPADVESMTVLKDAAASAIYGARGANGVILVNTKKGKKSDAEIRFDAKFGTSSVCVPRYDIIDEPGQYYELAYKQLYNNYKYNGFSETEATANAQKNLLDRNNGGLGYLVYTVPEGESLIGTNGKLNPNATLGYSDGTYYYTPDDWYDETYKTPFRQEYNLSVSGANDRFNYYASVGYLNQDGLSNNSNYQRYTGRSNIDYQVKKWLKLSAQLNFTHTNYQQPDYTTTSWASSGNIFYYANNMGPIYPMYVRNADGSIARDKNGMVVYDSNQTNFARPNFVGNPYRDNEYDQDKSYRNVFGGNWSAILTPIDGLTLTARIGVNSDNRRTTNLYSEFGNAVSSSGAAELISLRQYSANKQFLANYVTDFATEGTHNLDVLVGYESYKYKYQYLMGYNTHLYNQFIAELGNAVGLAADKKLDSYTHDYLTKGIFGRAQYDYKEKYVVSASFRRDGSSRFPNNRWGNFYSAGAAWNIAKEDFMTDYDWVDLLKIKASYGEQGNDNLANADYPYYPSEEVSSPGYAAGEWSTTLKQIENTDLTWEKNRNFNVGVDFGLFKSRLSGSIEFFNRSTKDLLYFLSMPLSSGYGSLTQAINIGSIRNRGIELQLNAKPISSKNFTWDVNLNLTHYKNTITSLHPTVRENGIKGSYYIYKEGGSLYQSYLYKFAGIYTENNFCGEKYDPSLAGKAMYYYDIKDKETGKVTGIDRTTVFSKASQYDCGDILPKLQGGMGMNFKFYDFDASFTLGFQLGGKFYDSQYQALMHTSDQSIGSAWHKDALNAWSETNQGSDIPRLDASYEVGQSAVDMYLISSNYLSINNVTIGYSLPRLLLSRVGVESLRIYVTGENLAVFSARKGLDPRFSFGLGSYTAGAGRASGNYSSLRSIVGGITLTF